MIIYVPPGQDLTIRFVDGLGIPTDGEFQVYYSADMTEIIVRESEGLPGNIKGEANAVLYHVDGKLGNTGLPFPELDSEVPQ